MKFFPTPPRVAPFHPHSHDRPQQSHAFQLIGRQSRLQGLGFFPVGGPPEELERLIRQDTDKWARLIRSAGIKADL